MRADLRWQDKSVPTSLATHLADVYLTELDKVGVDGGALVRVLSPHVLLAARTPNATVHKRIMDIVVRPALATLAGEKDEWESIAGIEDAAGVRKALLSSLFTTAAEEVTVESNRRRMYQLVREEDDE